MDGVKQYPLGKPKNQKPKYGKTSMFPALNKKKAGGDPNKFVSPYQKKNK